MLARGARTVAPAGAGAEEGGATERRRGGAASGKACRSSQPHHEERGEEGLLVAAHCAPRRAISPRPRTGHLPEHRGMGAAVEQAKGKGGGGGGAAPQLGVHAGAGWAELHLVLTAGDIGRHSRGRGLGQVAYDVGRISVQPRAQRTPHGEVLISPSNASAPSHGAGFGTRQCATGAPRL